MKPLLFAVMIAFLSFFSATASENGAADFHYVDSFAINAPTNLMQDTASIAAYLLQACHNDMDKARAAFTWIAYNIRYDDNAYNTGKPGNLTPAGVLKNHHTVCEGYANLYRAIATAMGLEAVRVDGYAKAYGYRPGEKFDEGRSNHSWNAVKINGEWALLDVTWGAGWCEGSRGHLVSHKMFLPYWFNVDKYQFAFKHLPLNSQWLLLPQTITLKQYEGMPMVPDPIFALGFDGQNMFGKAMAKELPKELPQAFPTPHQVTTVDFPLDGLLSPTNEATFTITSNEDLDIVASNDLKKPAVPFTKSGNTYTVKMSLKRGDLHIAIKDKGNRYSDILLYKVK